MPSFCEVLGLLFILSCNGCILPRPLPPAHKGLSFCSHDETGARLGALKAVFKPLETVISLLTVPRQLPWVLVCAMCISCVVTSPVLCNHSIFSFLYQVFASEGKVHWVALSRCTFPTFRFSYMKLTSI